MAVIFQLSGFYCKFSPVQGIMGFPAFFFEGRPLETSVRPPSSGATHGPSSYGGQRLVDRIWVEAPWGTAGAGPIGILGV